MFDTELRRKVAWLIAIRAIVGSALLGSASFVQRTRPTSITIDPFFFLIGLLCALTIAYALVLKQVDTRRWLIDMQLVADAIVVSLFIYLTGGVTSYFASLYVLPIAAGSVVQFRRGGVFVAAVSTILYVEIVLGQYVSSLGVLGHIRFTGLSVALPAPSVAQHIVGLNVLGYFAVALLSGSLAEGVRTRNARLEEASTQLADLQALNQHVIDRLPSRH